MKTLLQIHSLWVLLTYPWKITVTFHFMNWLSNPAIQKTCRFRISNLIEHLLCLCRSDTLWFPALLFRLWDDIPMDKWSTWPTLRHWRTHLTFKLHKKWSDIDPNRALSTQINPNGSKAIRPIRYVWCSLVDQNVRWAIILEPSFNTPF